MRSEISEIVSLTVLFALLYAFMNFQTEVLGRVLIVIQTDMLIAIYSFLLAYIIFGLFRYTKPVKPFALSVAFYLILKVVAYSISKFSAFAIVYPFVYTMDMYFLLFFLGFGVARVELPEFKKVKYIQPVVSAAGLFMMGYFGYVLISSLPVAPEITEKIAIGFLAFLFILAATSLANLSEKPAAKWLRNSRWFLLSFLILAVSYYVVIRPKILDRPGLVNFMEWALVGIFLLKFSSDFRKSTSIEEIEAVEVHRQRLSYRKDEIIQRLEEARRMFLEEGKKSPLIISLSRILFDSGWSEDRIAALISPLISYSDEKIPKISFNWEKNMIVKKNRSRRVKILKKIEEKLQKEGVSIGSESV